MRLSLKVMLFCLTFLFSPSLMASDATDLDMEAMPLRAVPAAPIAYQNPPDSLLGESCVSTRNADPLWINWHQNKLKSKNLKLTIGAIIITTVGIGFYVLADRYKVPRQIVNATVYNCTLVLIPFPILQYICQP